MHNTGIRASFPEKRKEETVRGEGFLSSTTLCPFLCTSRECEMLECEGHRFISLNTNVTQRQRRFTHIHLFYSSTESPQIQLFLIQLHRKKLTTNKITSAEFTAAVTHYGLITKAKSYNRCQAREKLRTPSKTLLMGFMIQLLIG